MKVSIVASVIVGFCLVAHAFGDAPVPPQSQRTSWKDVVFPGAATSNLTLSIINSTLSVLGVFAFTMAFVIIPVIALFYTSGSWSGAAHFRKTRSLQKSQAHIRLARGILDNDRCIERIVCEVSKGSRQNRMMERWTDAVFNSIPNEGKFMRRISNAYRGRTLAADCGTYSCEPVGFIVRLFIYSTDWNTILKG